MSIVKTITMTPENLQHCRSIAEELERIVSGDYVTIDEEIVEVNEDPDTGARWTECNGIFYADDDFTDDDGNRHEYSDPEIEAIDNLEPASVYSYFEDCLNIEYVINADKSYKSVILMVTCGGPNIYVNTNTGKVELYWWTEYAECELSRDVIDAIDEAFEEYYNM